jgi:hypothetical protein
MTTEVDKIKALLHNAQRIMHHQEEIKRLRGESFNVFYILKMESYENETHSAFIGELLNPNGSHFLNSTFLKLFLETVGYKGALDCTSAKLVLEKFIGSRDDESQTGGRVDIYIHDVVGNSICIENKIYAHDQRAQIARYVNHNKGKNTVYYLTLEGTPASEASRGALKEEQDYTTISYKSTILQWLDKCLKESAEHAILRESIRQYIILVKRLTHQLTDSKMEKEIENLIRNNYTVAKILASNVNKIEVSVTHDLLLEIKAIIDKELDAPWQVSVDNDLSQSWTGLRITHPAWNGIEVKLEGYSKMPWGNNYYGIVANETEYDRSDLLKRLSDVHILQSGFIASKSWPHYKYILDLSTDEKRAVLFDNLRRLDVAKEVANSLIALAKECKQPLSGVERLKS